MRTVPAATPTPCPDRRGRRGRAVGCAVAWPGTTSAACWSTFGPIDQDTLEVLLRAEVHKRGADLRFSTELTWFDQDDAGVTAVLHDRAIGQQQTVRAGYLIAADGNSPIRRRLGIGVDGPGPLFTTITAIVEADLNPPCAAARSPSPTCSSPSRSPS
jgi:2-polyprenyl-6-methoxyphenol hydroxylase-like FAD-dependent oxidoreductase